MPDLRCRQRAGDGRGAFEWVLALVAPDTRPCFFAEVAAILSDQG
jgi:hypothetical protein